MPVVFGPTTGPRQGPDGKPFRNTDTLRICSTVSFLTEASALEGLLPPFCTLAGEPIVTIEHTQLKELEWLAGRGYSLLGVRFPVTYAGPEETLDAFFLSVLWENMCEPILSGREELGFAKLYCELPEPRALGDTRRYAAHWDGHEFFSMEMEGLVEADAPPPPPVAGVLHHRYFPAVSSTGATEVEQMVLTPFGPGNGPPMRMERVLEGKGTAAFKHTTWEQMPTMYHIANRLAGLPVLEWRGAQITQARGVGDLSTQRVLR